MAESRASPDPAEAVVRAGRAALVGRSEELARLAASLERAWAGEPAVVVVSGEAGIGKTRLLADFCRVADRRGARVLAGSAYEAEGMPPYLPFVEALRPLCRSIPARRLRRLLGPTAGELVRWVPELADRLGPLPPSCPLPEGEARLRLFDSVVAFLARLARETPLVLFLDDLQWADSGSLDFLGYLPRKAGQARLLVLAAHRPIEPEGAEGLGRTLAELNRQRLVTRVGLERLSAADTEALLGHLLGGAPSPELSRQVYRQSEGNPFFVEEFLRFLVEAGKVRRRGGLWAALDAGDGARLPPSIRATILQRCATLGADCRALLGTAAVMGRRFRQERLARAAGVGEEAAEAHLRTAGGLGLVAPEAGGEWRFVHDKIRETLYAEVTRVHRRRLHTRIGRTLEHECRVGRAVPMAELAFHFSHSEDARKGIAYSVRAADEAIAGHAYGEAIPQYRTAIELLERTEGSGGGPARRRAGSGRMADLQLRLGEAQMAVADHEAALGSYEQALALYRQRRHRLGVGRALRRIGTVHARQEALDRALDGFQQALAAWEGLGHAEVVELLVQIGTAYTINKARYDDGEHYSLKAVRMARRLRDRRLQAIASLALGHTRTRRNQLEPGRQLFESALRLALDADDPATAAEASASLAVQAHWTGDMEASRQATLRREALARRCGDLYQLRHVYTWLAFLAWCRGEWAEAERWMREAEPILERLDAPEPRAFHQKIRGLILYQQGDLVAAERLLAQAMEAFRQMDPGVLVWYLGLLGLARLELGRGGEAKACLTEVEELVDRFPRGALPCGCALNALGIGAARLRDRERAARCYEQLLAFRGRFFYFLCDRVLGMLAALRQAWDEADAHFAAAADRARRHGLRPELGFTLLEWARARLARDVTGTRPGVVADLEEAIALFAGLGMARGEAEARAVLAKASPDRRTPAGSRALGSLTARQIEVLRLVADGKPNREIAEALGVSEKTVMNHLTAIFNKTGADNRAAATAFAFRHGLI